MDARSSLQLRSGSAMPILGLGTWELTDDTAGTVAHALQLGYRMIDTAADYGTHAGIGEAIRRVSLDRRELFITAKTEENEDAYAGTCRDLDELGLDHVDLVLLHRPPPGGPGLDLWRGLVAAREAGLARDIGVSNYSVDQMRQIADATGNMPAVNQIEWSPSGHASQMLAFCQDNGILIQAYCPLTRTRRLGDATLNEIAGRHDKTPAQILIRWNLQLGTAALPKANRLDHLKENIEVFDFELTDDDMLQLGDLNEHYSALGSLPYV